MATTTLQPGAYPGRPYGSFAGKEAGAGSTPHNPGRITTLWGYGGPGHLYGSFAGKESGVGSTPHNPGRLTTLWPYGGSGHLYGSFAGKETGVGGNTVTIFSGISRANGVTQHQGISSPTFQLTDLGGGQYTVVKEHRPHGEAPGSISDITYLIDGQLP